MNASDGLDVRVEQGKLRGIEDGEMREWRGIPYAAPPVADLRWRPPAAPADWRGLRAATEFAPRCIQPFVWSEAIGSEDCLYLNVFVPLRRSDTVALPVMVHIHGGDNSSFRPYTDASALVAHDVIVVTFGYRLGVFGFMGHPALSAEGDGASGEYALLDQIAALRWVQTNIAAFGGDPENVTLFGQSAGSYNALALVASPLTQGLFHRAALQGQSYWSLHGTETMAMAEEVGLEVGAIVGCEEADGLQCLRSASADALALAHGFRDYVPWVGGSVLPASPLELLEGQAETIPLLVGSNLDEAAHWFDGLYWDTEYSDGAWQELSDGLLGSEAGLVLRQMYAESESGSLLASAVASITDLVHTCPVRRLANTSKGTVWRYVYGHRLENTAELSEADAGQFTEEVLLWHDSTLVRGLGVSDYEFTPNDDSISSAMAAYWTNFAKKGDPNGRGLERWKPHRELDRKRASRREPREPQEAARILVVGDVADDVLRWRADACTVLDSVPVVAGRPELMRQVPSSVLDSASSPGPSKLRDSAPRPEPYLSVDPADGSAVEAVIAAAEGYLGAPYRLGTEGPAIFDCSGLMFRIFGDANQLNLIGGHRLRAVGYLRWFSSRGLSHTEAAERGDLVIWGDGAHIGIYLGDGKVISALLTGVAVHDLHGITWPFTTFLKVSWPDSSRPTSEPPHPEEAGGKVNHAGAPELQGTAIGTMNLRIRPAKDADVIGWIGRGATFTITGTAADSNGELWFSVFKRDGTPGWVHSHWAAPQLRDAARPDLSP